MMNILLSVSNALIGEAMRQLLNKNGYEHAVIEGEAKANGFVPDLILVDINTIGNRIFNTYPDAKVLLMDTGIGEDKIIATLLSYKIHGILSTQTEVHLLKKALQVVSEGQVWIDNNTVKSCLHNSGALSRNGQMNGVTTREKEITDLVVQGCSNKEIAEKLFISEHTVKAHMNRIFRKFNTTSRSKLITLVVNNGVKGNISQLNRM
jgi:LuxR family transcriptional regulator, positive regulator of biofilm formation